MSFELDAIEALYQGKFRQATIHSPGNYTAWDKDGKVVELNKTEVNKKAAELKAAYDSKKYQRDREVSYPKIGDQLDNLYKDILAGKLNSTGEFAKAIKTIKDANPKP